MAQRVEHDPGDFSGLAARVVSGLEGGACVIATRDGLALGAYPAGEEGAILARWSELGSGATTAARGFLVLDDQAWVVATTRRYVGVAVVPATVRPGLVLQRLEAAMEGPEDAAEEERPPLPFHAVRTPAHPPAQHPPAQEVSPDLMEVARVLGRLTGRPASAVPAAPEAAPWPTPDPAGTIGG